MKKIILLLYTLVLLTLSFEVFETICYADEPEDSIIPTNGYLSGDDALMFLRFVFNDSGNDDGLSDEDIIQSDFYRMCTGDLAGTEEEMLVIKEFLLFLYPQINRHVASGWSVLNSGRARLQSYLEDKCAGMDNLPEEEFNKVRNKVLKQLSDGIVEFLTSQLAIKTYIVVSQKVLDDLSAAQSVYGGITSLPAKIENFTNTIVTAVQTSLMPLGAEMSGRYTYFASYLDCRNLGAPDDAVFQTAMDYNFYACKNNSGLAAGFMNCIPGKVSWIKKRRLIEHWAEFVYQLEQMNPGSTIGSVDTSTYYYENPTEDETIDFNWHLYDNGILVIWGEGVLSYSTAPWNSQKGSITRVFICDGITSIGTSVFSGGYSNLEYVSIPDSVTSIGNYAFYQCSRLKEVAIPASVTNIGTQAFRDCTGLMEVTCHTGEVSFQTDIFAGCYKISRVKIEGTGAMPDYGSSGNVKGTAWHSAMSSLTNGGDVEVTVGEGITSVGSYAFEGCSKMDSITLPETIGSIGDYAFSGCGITGIEIPGGVSQIGRNAFSNCKKLSGIRIPENVTVINAETFRSCGALKSAGLSGSVVSIGDYVFEGCTRLEGIEIPETVTSIGKYAFYQCSSLKEVAIPASVTNIGTQAFRDCTGLMEVTCHTGEVSFQTDIFAGCYKISRVKIEGTGAMPDYGSSGNVKGTAWHSTMSSLTNGGNVEVTVGEGITSVGSYAFEGCSKMDSITLPETIGSIGDYAFYRCTGLNKVIYRGTLNKWSNIAISSNNDPLLQCKIEYVVAHIEPDYILPASTRVIKDEAFAGIYATSILLGNQVERIGNRAFANCTNLQQIVIPESVADISENAFEGCNDIVIIGESGSYAETYAKNCGFTFVLTTK